jgi:hypothetical protein
VVSFGEILGTLPFEDLKGSHLGTSGILAYANSKLMLYTWGQELQMRLARAGRRLDVFSTQPGGAGVGGEDWGGGWLLGESPAYRPGGQRADVVAICC